MRRRAAFLALWSMAALLGEAWAWERHDLLTRESLAEVGWLDSLPELIVTTRTHPPEGLAHDYAFPFRGESPGGAIRAREVLERYADEPDRGLDSGMRASWLQKFLPEYAGSGSQRLYHALHPQWTTHFPLQGLAAGNADERADLFYKASRLAFDREEPYWGFRYLACALHYVQDAAQPFHSSETSTAFMFQGHSRGQTARVLANFHHATQGWIARRMVDDAFELKDSLRGAHGDSIRFGRAGEGLREVASQSRAMSQPLFDAAVSLLDRRFREPLPVAARDLDTSVLEPAAAALALAKASRPLLRLTGRATRGLLEMARPIIRERFLEPIPPSARPR